MKLTNPFVLFSIDFFDKTVIQIKENSNFSLDFVLIETQGEIHGFINRLLKYLCEFKPDGRGLTAIHISAIHVEIYIIE